MKLRLAPGGGGALPAPPSPPSGPLTRQCGELKEPGEEQRPLQAGGLHHLLLHRQRLCLLLGVLRLQGQTQWVTSVTYLLLMQPRLPLIESGARCHGTHLLDCSVKPLSKKGQCR